MQTLAPSAPAHVGAQLLQRRRLLRVLQRKLGIRANVHTLDNGMGAGGGIVRHNKLSLARSPWLSRAIGVRLPEQVHPPDQPQYQDGQP
eukprot:scaffold6059_cov103-Isochrysis_galbana.AAC.2